MRAPLVALVALLMACGARSATLRPVTPDAAREVDGLTVFEMTRPTGGLLVATLVFDVGSRQASPPALATLAAWSRETPNVNARVTLDTTELRAECPADAAGECIAALVEALEKENDSAGHAALRARLERAQRADLGDPSRRVESLALAAAWGEDLHPLAATEDTGAALSQEAMTGFRASHYGRGRCVLRLEGDLSGEPDAAPLAAALVDAALPRPEVSLPEGADRALRVETGGVDALAVAFHFRDAERARGLAETIARDGASPKLFRVRGGAVVLVIVSDGEDLTPDHVDGARQLLARSRRRERTRWVPSGVDAWLLEREGDPLAFRAGIGVVCAERPERDIDACRAMAQPLVDSGNIAFDGASSESGAVGTFEGGARILVRRQPGSVGVALLWAGGAAEDAPAQHGARALAAIALARSCGGTPFVSPHHFGFSKELAAGDGAALDATFACAAQGISTGAWSDARQRAHRNAAARPERGWLARHLAPSAPGWVVPEGSVQGIAEARLGPWLRAARARPRFRVAVVGDVDVAAALEVAGNAVAMLPTGDAPPEPSSPIDAEAAELSPEHHEGPYHRVVVAWHGVGAAEGAAEGARGFAAHAEAALRGRGLRTRWSDGGGDSSGSWAAVALDLDDAQLESLPRLVERMPPQGGRSAGRAAMRAGLEPRQVALRAARTQRLEVPEPSSDVATSLRDSTPRFIIGRRQEPEALRRSRR